MRRLLRYCFVGALVLLAGFAYTWFYSSNPSQQGQWIKKSEEQKNNLLLVSWNACNFGRTKKPETIHFMAHILRDADIVALQEVSTSEFGAQAVAKLSDELNRTGSQWDYVISDATTGPGTERFAFLFKTRQLRINRNDCKLVSSLEDVMDREPALLVFHDGQRSFIVVNFHLQPDDQRSNKDPRKELIVINENAKNIFRGPTILVGDFNLGHADMRNVFEKALGFSHNINAKTSLKMKQTGNGEYVNRAFDNIYTREIKVHDSGVYDFVMQFPDLKSARNISDHLPVYITFSL